MNFALGTVGRWRPGIQGQSLGGPTNTILEAPVTTVLTKQIAGLNTATQPSQPLTMQPIDFLQRLELVDHKGRDVADGQSLLDSSSKKSESMGALTTSMHLVMSTEERKRSKSQRSVLDDRLAEDRSSSELSKAVDAYFAIEYNAVT